MLDAGALEPGNWLWLQNFKVVHKHLVVLIDVAQDTETCELVSVFQIFQREQPALNDNGIAHCKILAMPKNLCWTAEIDLKQHKEEIIWRGKSNHRLKNEFWSARPRVSWEWPRGTHCSQSLKQMSTANGCVVITRIWHTKQWSLLHSPPSASICTSLSNNKGDPTKTWTHSNQLFFTNNMFFISDFSEWKL